MVTRVYADGADAKQMLAHNADPHIHGLTTNPSLFRAAGITNYQGFARDILQHIKKPISFEVIADDFNEMERQAHIIAGWADNVYVKIPIMNTRGESSVPLIEKLSRQKIKVNVTAIMTGRQIKDVAQVLIGTPAIISIFAGRMADTGVSPQQYFILAREVIRVNVQTLWASTRELYNIKQAKQCGADIITVPDNLLRKMGIMGYDLHQYSQDTVKQFHDDAKACGFVL